MNTLEQKFDSREDEIAAFDVTDEVLESAAGTEALASFTYLGCTAVTYCLQD